MLSPYHNPLFFRKSGLFLSVKRIGQLLLTIFFLTGLNRAQALLKIADFFRNPIEYRSPILVIPFEIKVGTQVLGFGSQPLLFDSTESQFVRYNQLFSRFAFNFEIEVAKSNFWVYLIPQNFIDMQTGVGIRYTNALMQIGVPGNWTNSHPITHESLYLAPQIREYNLNQSLIFQWAPQWYGYFTFSYGWTHASAYVTRTHERYLPQDGNTYSFVLGIRRLGSTGFRVKEGYGLELKYTLARMHDLKDKLNITPITQLNLNSFGIQLTFNANLGGSRTQGDDAKELYRTGDYLAAKANFEEFLRRYPRHPRRFKAEWMMQECIKRIPYQEIVLADDLINARDYGRAAEHLAVANNTTNMALRMRVENNYQKITNWFQTSMDSLIVAGQVEPATKLLTDFEKYQIPNSQSIIDRYWSEIFFHRGAVLTEYGMWEKAIDAFDKAIGKYPPIRERVQPWLLKIAYGYINDANKSVDKASIALALESLRKATATRPEIADLTKPYIRSLEEGLNYLKQEAGRQQLRQTINRIFNPPKNKPEPTIGMTTDSVRSLLGEPSYRNRIQDATKQEYELWLYVYANDYQKYYYFLNDKLYKIETTTPPGTTTEE